MLALLLVILLQNDREFYRVEREFKTSFRGAGRQERIELIRAVARHDRAGAAALLMDALRLAADEYARAVERRASLAENFGSFREEDLYQRLTQLEEQLVDAVLVIDAALTGFQTVRGAAAVERVTQTLGQLADARLRALLARALARAGAHEPLERLLAGDPDRRVRLAALEGLLDLGHPECAESALADSWELQTLAVRAVVRGQKKESVPKLIDALAGARGRIRHELLEALSLMTGVRSLTTPEAWKRWWEKSGEAFLKGEYKPGADEARPPTAVTFYGLPVDSDHVVFVLDVSASMQDPAGNQPEGHRGSPLTKLEIAQREIEQAIRGLSEDVQFGLIAFSKTIRMWRPKLVKADKDAKKQALEWLKEQKSGTETNSFGALAAPMLMGGLDEKGSNTQGPDTIFFVSDGAPTAGAVTEVDRVLRVLEIMNGSRRVKVHAVAVVGMKDTAEHVRLMKGLAEMTGGRFAQK